MGVIQRLIPHAAFIVAETIHNRIQKRIDTVSQILSWGFAISHFFSLSTLGLILAGWLSLKTVMGFCLQIHSSDAYRADWPATLLFDLRRI